MRKVGVAEGGCGCDAYYDFFPAAAPVEDGPADASSRFRPTVASAFVAFAASLTAKQKPKNMTLEEIE